MDEEAEQIKKWLSGELRANVELSHRIARVSKIMIRQLGVTPHDMFQLAKLVHRVESYEDLPERFRVKVEEAEKIADQMTSK
jgi:hypothetical protein